MTNISDSKFAALSRSQRAAILYAANAQWRQALNIAVNNAPSGQLPNYTIWTQSANPIEYNANKPLDYNSDGAITLLDLQSILARKESQAQFQAWISSSNWGCSSP